MFWFALFSTSRTPEPNAVSFPDWPPRIALRELFRASVISSAFTLNVSSAALPAPLNFPYSGSAAWISNWISVPRSWLEPTVLFPRSDSVVEPMSNFINPPP